jgi:hypothetical protein
MIEGEVKDGLLQETDVALLTPRLGANYRIYRKGNGLKSTFRISSIDYENDIVREIECSKLTVEGDKMEMEMSLERYTGVRKNEIQAHADLTRIEMLLSGEGSDYTHGSVTRFYWREDEKDDTVDETNRRLISAPYLRRCRTMTIRFAENEEAYDQLRKDLLDKMDVPPGLRQEIDKPENRFTDYTGDLKIFACRNSVIDYWSRATL